MYSIDCNSKIIKGLGLIDVDLILPHEKIIKKNTSSIINFLKSFDDHIVLSSILCCSKSMVIIDGHHRYHSLKKLGFKKIPVTKLDYSSKEIKNSLDHIHSKDKIIEHGVKIGNNCHISTRAVINGEAEVKDNTFIGSGAVVREGIKIGKNCFIGMGQTVIKNLKDNTIIK